MHIALVLHIYQPPTQYRKMLDRITRESYQRIVETLEETDSAKLTLNLNASLTEQLAAAGFGELLGRIKKLSETGQIEFTGSAAYHPILPDLPKREIARQINLNTTINQSYFGSAYQPKGFFPPELAYNEILGEVLERLGFGWTLIDGTGIADWQKYLEFIYRRENGKLLVFPREDVVSWKIAFGRIRTVLGLQRTIGAQEMNKRQYLVLAMDGETFGHHQPKQLDFLKRLFQQSLTDRQIKMVTVSQLKDLYTSRRPTEILPSTWGFTEEAGGERVWVRWRNPQNPLHVALNRLRSIAIEAVDSRDKEARGLLDKALASDTWWWASGKPFWHPDMVKRGAQLLCSAVGKSRNATAKQRDQAHELCYRVIPEEFQHLRTKNQRKRVLDRANLDRHLGRSDKKNPKP
jgi:alpha-amylase/alpha-mannosidase (GH57 family)